MKHESTLRMTCGASGLAAGLLLATCLVLTPGCGTEPPKSPESPVTTGGRATRTREPSRNQGQIEA